MISLYIGENAQLIPKVQSSLESPWRPLVPKLRLHGLPTLKVLQYKNPAYIGIHINALFNAHIIGMFKNFRFLAMRLDLENGNNA